MLTVKAIITQGKKANKTFDGQVQWSWVPHLFQPPSPGAQEDHTLSIVHVGGDRGQPLPALSEHRLTRDQLGTPQGLVYIQAAEVVIDGNRLRGQETGIRSLKTLLCFVMLLFVFPGRQGKKLRLKGGRGGEWREGGVRVTDRRGGGGNEMSTSASQASDWDRGRHVRAWEENSGWRAISAACIQRAISKVKNGYFKRVFFWGGWEVGLLLGFINKPQCETHARGG